jgi:hypothetical protein
MKLKTLNSIYPEHLIDEISTLYLLDLRTVAGRTEYFTMCWENWKDNEVQMQGGDHFLSGSMYQIPKGRFNTKSNDPQQKLRDAAEEHGLQEFWDFIIKGKSARFRRSDDAIYYRLAL